MAIDLVRIDGTPSANGNPTRGYIPFFLRRWKQDLIVLHPTASARVMPLVVLLFTILLIVATTPPLVRSIAQIVQQEQTDLDWITLGILLPVDTILLCVLGIVFYRVFRPGKWIIDRDTATLQLHDGQHVTKSFSLNEIKAVQILFWDALESSPYSPAPEITPTRAYQLNLVLGDNGTERYAIVTVYDDVKEQCRRWLISSGKLLAEFLNVPLATHQNWKLIGTTDVVSRFDTAFARDKHLQQPPASA